MKYYYSSIEKVKLKRTDNIITDKNLKQLELSHIAGRNSVVQLFARQFGSCFNIRQIPCNQRYHAQIFTQEKCNLIFKLETVCKCL